MKKIVKVHMLPAKLKQPLDHLNQIFLNDTGVLSFLTDEEDIIKSAQWFGARPQHLYLTLDEETKSDKFWIIDNREGMNGFIHEVSELYPNTHRIITTTNPTLWEVSQYKDVSLGIDKIDNNFIKAYIKAYNEGHPITEATLEYKYSIKIIQNN